MPKHDPLALIPTPKAIRRRLAENEDESQKLHILLELSERLHHVDESAVPVQRQLCEDHTCQ